eukprot:gnl/MRDRNA2_/MRDRNA2_155809_c0_seq1.p1 gnl/MRDRNA2_/MRDRNA2_155809_c0~~gnl/MRDRNA2_/MRDRNA2_155809_c0_seq1.p1  ORF type:complete len:194 (+),score=46.99 gnl/MRDRNA2_/MRDRNA2_155809_c0_seq1:196-777(+)
MNTLDPDMVSTLFAPYITDEEVFRFAATGPSFAQTLLHDSTWQPRLWQKFGAEIQPFYSGQGDVPHSRALHDALCAVSKNEPPLLRKPRDALIRWEVHESQMWNKTVQMWANLRRSQVIAHHFGSHDVQDVTDNLIVVEADLQALQLLAQAPNRRSAEGLEPPVRRALDQMWRKRWEQKTRLRQQLLEDLYSM